MDRFLLFFMRLLIMAFGFFVACIVTGSALAFMTNIFTPGDVRAIGDFDTMAGIAIAVLAVASITAYAAMVPAMFIVLYAEIRSRRDWLFYCLAGGATALLTLSFVLMNPQQAGGPSAEFIAIAIVAGMLGGVAYWLVAGHAAGGWLPRQIKRARLQRQQEPEEK